MLENYIRPWYQKVAVDPLVTRVGNLIAPNMVTLLSCLTGLTILPALLFHQTTIACLLLLISGYFDTLDGSIARLRHEESAVGCVFDILSDRIVEVVIIMGLYLFDPMHRALLTLSMLGSVLVCVTSFLVVGIFTSNHSDKGFHYSPGIMERAEAFILFLFMFLFPNLFTKLAMVFVILVLLTALIRVYQFAVNNVPDKQLKEEGLDAN